MAKGLVLAFVTFASIISLGLSDNDDNGPEKQRWVVSWNAPFLSGSGYGSEAIAAAVGLNETLPPDNWTVTIGQHGDSVDNAYAMNLPPDLIKFLTLASKTQFGLQVGEKGSRDGSRVGMDEARGLSAERTIVVCHSEPGAWSLPEPHYDTEPCPPDLAEPYKRRWHYVVGRTMFETDRLPDGWSDRLNRVDEVWVPTQHHKAIFDKAGVKNVRVVGQGIDADRWDPAKTEPIPWEDIDPDGQCKESDVKFLSVFKWEKRKGHDVLLPAFWTAFPPRMECAAATNADGEEDVEGGERGACLIIVTGLYHTNPDEVFGDLQKYWTRATKEKWPGFESTKGVILLNGIPEDELIRLYRSVDAFVLPSRGEGWGRPYMEAMAMGLPVVATNWSGPTEFINEENGYLLPITGLVDAKLPAFPGHKWADPDEEALRRLLTRIRDDPDEGRRKGQRARRDVVELWSHRSVAKHLAEELERIAKLDLGAMPRIEDEL